MRMSALGRLLGFVLLLAVLCVGLVVAFVITAIWPQALLAGIVVSCTTVILVMIGTIVVSRPGWILWLALPALALTGLGAVMLAEDLGVSRSGEPTHVVIVAHTVDVDSSTDSSSDRDRKAYTHTYELERTDGSPVEKPIIYRGEDGYDDFDTGDTITVLVDPEGEAPTEPADSVNVGADLAILIVGFIGVLGVYGMCSLLLFLKPPTARDVR